MSVLSELNTLLEKIPVWKELIALPKRVTELEKRLETLEKGTETTSPDNLTKYKGLFWEKDNPLPICPSCKSQMGSFEDMQYVCNKCKFMTDFFSPPRNI